MSDVWLERNPASHQDVRELWGIYEKERQEGHQESGQEEVQTAESGSFTLRIVWRRRLHGERVLLRLQEGHLHQVRVEIQSQRMECPTRFVPPRAEAEEEALEVRARPDFVLRDVATGDGLRGAVRPYHEASESFDLEHPAEHVGFDFVLERLGERRVPVRVVTVNGRDTSGVFFGTTR
jgi:hypothetical protein